MWMLRASIALLLSLLATGVLFAQDVAQVQVQGQPVLSVTSGGGVSASARAEAISDSLAARIASAEPLAPVRVVPSDSAAALVIGTDTLLQVLRRDAEVVLARPVPAERVRAATQQVARQWAAKLQEAFLRVATQEPARVVVQGTPLFEIRGSPELRAVSRAAAVGVRIAEIVAQEGEPPEIRVGRQRGQAVVLAGKAVLVEVTAADTLARGMGSAELAAEWAETIRSTLTTLRRQQTWPYRLRMWGEVLAAVLAMTALHLLLRKLAKRVRRLVPTAPEHLGALTPVFVHWGLSVIQFLGWLALGVFVFWRIPSTRPLTFAVGAQALTLLEGFLSWLVGDGLLVALTLVATFFAARFTGAAVRQFLRVYGMRPGARSGLRAETLEGTLAGMVQLLVGFVGLLAILAQLELDPVPLLASAGVAGIALGFGVQSLIRDFSTGLFILLEDQYGVGDLIRVGEIAGKVERFTLRITQVRSLDGSLTSIPNGEITTVTNLSKDWSQVVLDVNIALGENVDKAISVIEAAAHALTEVWADRIQGEPEVLGVETVDPLAQAITIRVLLRTAPMERWTVSRELRRRILDAFRAEDIQVPPRSVVTISGSGPPPG